MQSLWEANKQMLAEEIATDETFLDRTSLLILADDLVDDLVSEWKSS